VRLFVAKGIITQEELVDEVKQEQQEYLAHKS